MMKLNRKTEMKMNKNLIMKKEQFVLPSFTGNWA